MLNGLLKEKEEKVALGRPYLSHSQVNRYQLCPEQYRLYYLEKLRPRIPSSNLVFGQVLHQSLAKFFLKQGDPLDWFRDTWKVIENVPIQYSGRDSWESLERKGKNLLEQFLATEAQRITGVESVEKSFELSFSNGSIPYVGVIDLLAVLDGKRSIIDFKTSSGSYDSHEVELSDQLTGYTLADPSVEQVSLCVLVKTKETKIEWHHATRTPEDLSSYLGKLGYVERQIRDEQFFKRPGMWCSWCDFLPLCRGNQKAAEATLIRV